MFDFEEFLEVAERLAASNDEGDQRSAISRAYYAVFHRARTFVRTENYYPGRTRLDHREVWSALLEDAYLTRANVGERVRRLHRARLNADYDRQFPGNLTQRTLQIVNEAKALIEEIDRL